MSRIAFGHETSFGVTMRVGAVRRDGKYPVWITYRSSGRTVLRILDREAVEREARTADRVTMYADPSTGADPRAPSSEASRS